MYNSELYTIATDDELKKYASVLVNGGLGKGEGIERGDVVLIRYTPEGAILVPYLERVIAIAGGFSLHDMDIPFEPGQGPDDVLAEVGRDAQLDFVSVAGERALCELADHHLTLRSLAYSQENPNIDNERYLRRERANRAHIKIIREFKEKWKSTTLAYVPSVALAKQSGVTLQSFWEQSVRACFLDMSDPVLMMRKSLKLSSDVAQELNKLDIRKAHIKGEHCDLSVEFSTRSCFVSSQGGNIPSCEIYTTPEASSTTGWLQSSYPLIYNGISIQGLWLYFKNGRVLDWYARSGKRAFASFLKYENANRLGEFALTDRRHSRIDRALPAAIMYLENIGGTAHVALGRGYPKCFRGNETPGRNKSLVHKDIVLGGDFMVTAETTCGQSVVIYNHGQFTFF